MIIDSGARMNNAAYTADTTVRTDTKPKADPAQNLPDISGMQKPKEKPQVQLPGQAQAQLQGQQEPVFTDENDNRKLKNAVDHANQTMRHSKTKCEFSYHEETKRVSIKVIDEETDEVIREIPPEETLEMLSKMWELAGLMVDEKR